MDDSANGVADSKNARTWVDFEFDCLPLRTVQRVDVPLDASPKYEQFVLRVKAALEQHGSHNTYYLHNAKCVFHLTNDASRGMLEFGFEGTVFTDTSDRNTKSCHIDIELVRENCDWLSEPVVNWFHQTVREALHVEFDRYIAAGDLQLAEERIRQIQAESDAAEGFLGMYL